MGQIMSITGHRSSNAVHLYKKISVEQQERISNLLQTDSLQDKKCENNDYNKENVPTSSTNDQASFIFNSCNVTINTTK